MHQARAQHLDVDAHSVHVRNAFVEVAHPPQDHAGALLDVGAHFIAHAGIGRQLGKDVVLGRQRIDLGYHHVSVDVDGAHRM